MKLTSLIVTSILAGVGLAFAGTGGKSSYIDKQPVIVDPTCDCFGAGLEVGGFVAGYFPEGAADEGLGGGISLAYFFTDKIGVDVSYAAFDTDPQAHHLSTADIVLRPFHSGCGLSPYFIAGGGVLSNGSNDGLWRAGLGIEWRGDSCLGVFADGVYNWVNDSDDSAVARVGIRIPF